MCAVSRLYFRACFAAGRQAIRNDRRVRGLRSE